MKPLEEMSLPELKAEVRRHDRYAGCIYHGQPQEQVVTCRVGVFGHRWRLHDTPECLSERDAWLAAARWLRENPANAPAFAQDATPPTTPTYTVPVFRRLSGGELEPVCEASLPMPLPKGVTLLWEESV